LVSENAADDNPRRFRISGFRLEQLSDLRYRVINFVLEEHIAECG